jgi:hypothetical protein
VKSVKTRSLKGFDLAVEKVKSKEAELMEKKRVRMQENDNYQPGLVFANLGSQYDVSTSAST